MFGEECTPGVFENKQLRMLEHQTEELTGWTALLNELHIIKHLHYYQCLQME